MAGEGNGTGSVLVVKNWHVVIVAVTWLVLGVMAFTELRAEADETSRRVQQLEQREPISYQEYKDGLYPIEQRLDRIEKKLDREPAGRH